MGMRFPLWYSRKEIITKVVNYVHLNLCIALICGLIVFLAGIQAGTSSRVCTLYAACRGQTLTSCMRVMLVCSCMHVIVHIVLLLRYVHFHMMCFFTFLFSFSHWCVQEGCAFVAFLLHYFFLAAFSWMLCEGIMLYNLLVKVFRANERKWIYVYTGLGWGECVFVLPT